MDKKGQLFFYLLFLKFKSPNVLLTNDLQAKLTDFGLAKIGVEQSVGFRADTKFSENTRLDGT
jgi:serine/threonine protein kinase